MYVHLRDREISPMEQPYVRIKSVEINNFKNVGHGKLDFEKFMDGKYASSVLGLYGQNGSGKTALIDVLELLKFALSGGTIPARFSNYIKAGSPCSVIRYEFRMWGEDGEADFYSYEVSIRREIDDSSNITDPHPSSDRIKYKTVLFDEVLSYAGECNGKRSRCTPLIDTRTEAGTVFKPAVKYKALAGKGKDTLTKLLVAKQLALASSRSFLFSRDFLSVLKENCPDTYYRGINRLALFGNYELFVINTSNTSLISLDALPLAINYTENGTASIGNILINLNEPTMIPEKAYDIVQKVIRSMNIVLKQIVPGLTICVKDLGKQMHTDGTVVCRIQLLSNRNGVEIPLQCESEGIKKLISVLQLMIVVYNKPSISVAIDELDSGIFEYLLGELLRIISEKGKGQLIFTSHNLRPLETLDKRFIAFTTTNPDKRYVRPNNIKSTNNVRNVYYRDIVLGGSSDPLYDQTNNAEIAFAFREAGVPDAP